MQRTIITTGDGSKTIHIPDWNENYHSSHGAVQEAKHVFLKHGLELFLGQPEIRILEIGFGTGLNAILTLEAGMESSSHIYYEGLEAFPISEEEMRALEYDTLLGSDFLKAHYEKLHNSSWETENKITPNFSLTKIQNELQKQTFPAEKFDLIYFDAFGPRVQEGMWTQEIFQKLYEALAPGGVLVTYCAKGQVKRDMKAVGFTVEALPGPPGKREMTKGRKL
jgi:tRNA U34 5-methylaminomethyl-2-thiouridine-forming methyltransferase MnmC